MSQSPNIKYLQNGSTLPNLNQEILYFVKQFKGITLKTFILKKISRMLRHCVGVDFMWCKFDKDLKHLLNRPGRNVTVHRLLKLNIVETDINLQASWKCQVAIGVGFVINYLFKTWNHTNNNGLIPQFSQKDLYHESQ